MQGHTGLGFLTTLPYPLLTTYVLYCNSSPFFFMRNGEQHAGMHTVCLLVALPSCVQLIVIISAHQ
jgi:hypothetical protein